jgi:Sulfotransferase family
VFSDLGVLIGRSLMICYEELHSAISELQKKQIFFIGGAVKSGTTWLQLLLDAHPEVSCNGEGHFLDNLAPALKMALDQHCGLIAEKNESLFNEIEGYPRLSGEISPTFSRPASPCS